MTALDELATGICPSCKTMEIDIRPDFIRCRVCGIHGDPKALNWCNAVPIFRTVLKENLWLTEGQLYKKNEQLFVLAGYFPGCHRVISGAFCDSCRSFIPTATDRPEAKRKKRAEKLGKDLAAGEKEVEL